MADSKEILVPLTTKPVQTAVGRSPIIQADSPEAALARRVQRLRTLARGSPLRMRREPSLDETISGLLPPTIRWASRREKTVTVTTTEQLQGALDNARAGDVIALQGAVFNGVKIKEGWKAASGPGFCAPRSVTWAPPEDREEGVVSLVNGNAFGQAPPMLCGVAIQQMIDGTELHVVGIRMRPKEEWIEDEQGARWDSGASIIGSWSNPGFGSVRCKSVVFCAPENSKAFGTGLLWGTRTYCISWTFEDCATDVGVVFKEHPEYSDNSAFRQHVRTHFGSAGRTHCQGGTRRDYLAPPRWLGVVFQGCRFEDAFCGSATGGSTTIYGYPGTVLIQDHKIRNLGHIAPDGKRLDPAAGLVVFETFNYGGNYPDPHGNSTGRVIIDGLTVELGAGKLDAVLLESITRADIRNLDTSLSAPGSGWVNAPGLYGTHGVMDLNIHGGFNAQLRSRIGPPGTKTWHVYSPEEIALLKP